MQENTLEELECAASLARLVTSKEAALGYPRTDYQRVLVGLTKLLARHLEGLLWATRQENLPVIMVLSRVIAEIAINLDYIAREPQYRNYRACLLLLEGPKKQLDILTSKYAPGGIQSHPELARLQSWTEQEKQDAISRLSLYEKAPSDPPRWDKEKGIASSDLFKRALGGDGLWVEMYVSLYFSGSAYIHSDGYAIHETEKAEHLAALLLTSYKPSVLSAAHVPAILAMDVISAFLDEFKHIAEEPDVIHLHYKFVSLRAGDPDQMED